MPAINFGTFELENIKETPTLPLQWLVQFQGKAISEVKGNLIALHAFTKYTPSVNRGKRDKRGKPIREPARLMAWEDIAHLMSIPITTAGKKEVEAYYKDKLGGEKKTFDVPKDNGHELTESRKEKVMELINELDESFVRPHTTEGGWAWNRALIIIEIAIQLKWVISRATLDPLLKKRPARSLMKDDHVLALRKAKAQARKLNPEQLEELIDFAQDLIDEA